MNVTYQKLCIRAIARPLRVAHEDEAIASTSRRGERWIVSVRVRVERQRAPARGAGSLFLRQPRLVCGLPPPRPLKVRRTIYAQRRHWPRPAPAPSSISAA